MNPELLDLTVPQIQFVIQTLEDRLALMKNVLARKVAELELPGKLDDQTLTDLIDNGKGFSLMATSLTYDNYETILSLLTTELNSITTAGYCAASAAQGADGTGGPLYGDFELVLASLNPTDNLPLAELYLIRSADGTNYEDVPSATNPGSGMYVGTFVGDYGSSAKRQIIPMVQLPPGLWKAIIKNVCGVTFASSGNTLKCRPYNLLST